MESRRESGENRVESSWDGQVVAGGSRWKAGENQVRSRWRAGRIQVIVRWKATGN